MLFLEQLETRCLLSDTPITPIPGLVVSDSIDPGDDFAIDFGDQPLGTISDAQFVQITNETDGSFQLASPVTDNIHYTTRYFGSREFPSGFNFLDANEIQVGTPFNDRIGQFVKLGDITVFEPTSWYVLNDVQAGDYLDINLKFARVDQLTVYSDYGTAITSFDTGLFGGFRGNLTEFDNVDSFVAPYSGRYYIELNGATIGNNQSQIFVKPAETTLESVTIYDSNTAPEDRQPITGTIGNIAHSESNWFGFNGKYGDQFEINFNNNPVMPGDAVGMEILNNFGQPIYSNTALDPASTIDFTVLEDTDYYIHIFTPQAVLSGINYDFTMVSTGSILTLPAQGATEIPVWFTPSDAGPLNGELVLSTEDGIDFAALDLSGNSLPGDFVVNDITFPELPYTQFVQAGKPLAISLDISNTEAGHIPAGSEIRFLLRDANTDNPKPDILLQATDGNPLTLESYVSNETRPYIATVDVTPEAFGNYYLVAEVNPADDQGQHNGVELNYDNNSIVSHQVFVDPYSTLLLPSQGDAVEKTLRFDKTAIQTTYPEQSIKIYNRGDEPITITGWYLQSQVQNPDETGSFNLLTFNNLNDATDNILLEPQESRRLWVRFSPSQFDPETKNIITDKLIIQTEETQALQAPDESPYYTYSLTGQITGADLIVEESSGATANDDLLVFDQDSVGYPIRPSTIDAAQLPSQQFVIKNIGDQPLIVNDLYFETGTDSAYSVYIPDENGNLVEPTLPLILQTEEAAQQEGVTNSQAFIVTFDPANIGDYDDTLLIISSDSLEGYSYRVNLHGEAVEPIITVQENSGVINDDQVDFGWNPVNTNNENFILREINVSNSGNVDLQINPIATPEHFTIFSDTVTLQQLNLLEPGETVISAEGAVIPPQQTYDLFVRFVPDAEGFFSGELVIPNNSAANNSYTVRLSAYAAEPQLVLIDSQGNSITQTDTNLEEIVRDASSSHTEQSDWFLIRNGKVNYTLTGISAPAKGFSLYSDAATKSPEGALIFYGDNGAPGLLLEPGQTIRVDYSYDAGNLTAADFAEAQDNRIQIVGPLNITGSRNEQIDLVASVVTPEIDLSVNALDFGAHVIATDPLPTRTLSITNTAAADSAADLIISDLSLTDADGQPIPFGNQLFSIDTTGPLAIPPGETADIQVSFTPMDIGDVQAYLRMETNDLDESITTVMLTGHSDGLPIELHAGKSHTFVDADGDLVKVSLNQGSGKLILNQGKLDQADIYAIELRGTTDKTNLKITTRGQTSIGKIVVIDNNDNDASLNTILAPNALLTDELHIDGSLKTIKIGDIQDNATLNINTPSSKPMTILAGAIGDNVTFNLAADIKTLQAKSYTGGSLQAQSIGKVKITAGDLGADLLADNTQNGFINNVKVAGRITGDLEAAFGSISKVQSGSDIQATILARDDIGTIKATRGSFGGTVRAKHISRIKALDLDNALISAADAIDSVVVKTDIIDSHILAGYDIGMDGLPGGGDAPVSAGQIGRIKFGGVFRNTYVTAGVMTDPVYLSLGLATSGTGKPDSSGIGKIGNTSGHKISFDNGGVQFGFYSAGQINLHLNNEGDFVVLNDIR